MALFYQHNINDTTKLGVWHIEEPESYFTAAVSLQRDITHPQKRLQHLAGRFLLQLLFPDFPSDLIEIADTNKPFLPNEAYHFSISHCGEYAAVIISKDHRVGIDIELTSIKVEKIKHKFLSKMEMEKLNISSLQNLTSLWSVKEAIFKWNGSAQIDFKKHIQLDVLSHSIVEARFVKEQNIHLKVHHLRLDELTLAFVATEL